MIQNPSQNPLIKLEALGQSIWLDYIRRHLIASGELQKLIDEDGISGVTSNPSIFEKAITGSHDYDQTIAAMQDQSSQAIYNAISIQDVQQAAEHFLPIYQKTQGRDGFVSLEVSPELARDTEGTIQEARRLWHEVNRPNVLIKVPGTREGVPAIQQLLTEGINVNITLLFSLEHFQAVAQAYINALEERAQQGKAIDHIASVASFFLSRIDVLVDPILEAKMKDPNQKIASLAQKAHGQVAIACARRTYQMYHQMLGTERFQKLAQQGAKTQRLLWASTSTKNPSYPDTKYVEALIGPDTINTIPMETLDAYQDHGNPVLTLKNHPDETEQILQALPKLGIDLTQVTDQLENEGIEKFKKPFTKLLDAIQAKSNANPNIKENSTGRIDNQQCLLGEYQDTVSQQLELMKSNHFMRRFYQKDPTLWKTEPDEQATIRQGLGWLNVAQSMETRLPEIERFVQEIQQEGFTHVLHMGMGGSSLAALAFQRIFSAKSGYPELIVLDINNPETISQIEQQLDLKKTLFIVASKSGTTAEPIAFSNYFYQRVSEIKEQPGHNFIAITDPDTALVDEARERHYRKVFLNYPDIGGRYSALSFFGMLPAALMGIDIAELLNRAQRMQHTCASCVPTHENPALLLGTTLGTLAGQGRDKITFLVEKPLEPLGMWLEQLLAESTGKEGRGLLPVANEPIGKTHVYGADRLFIHIGLNKQSEDTYTSLIQDLQKAGHPIIQIQLTDLLDIGQEFMRWEIAVAVAGGILGINAFDQPNVQESKENTKHILKTVSEQGHISQPEPILTEGLLSVYSPLENLKQVETVAEALDHWLAMGYPGYYIALMAYFQDSPETEKALQEIRQQLRDRQHLATTLGYGPRFLHSTGQYHKGGPNTGLFLQLTAQDKIHIPIPGYPYDFSTFKQAEALGDLQSLERHGRRILRIDLGASPLNGLAQLKEALSHVLFSRL